MSLKVTGGLGSVTTKDWPPMSLSLVLCFWVEEMRCCS